MRKWIINHKSQILKTLLLIVIVVAIAVSGYFILRACGFTDKQKYLDLRNQLGDSIWFWMIIACLQIIQVIFIPVSNQIITVPLALIFPIKDLWKVFITSWLSIWLATLILYFIGRWGGKKILGWVLKDNEQTEKCSNFLKRGWMFYPLAMLLPLPDDIITIIAGTGKMNFLFVMGSSFLTRAIDVACSVFGFGILTKYWWGWLILAIGVVLLILCTIYFIKREKKNNGKCN